MLSEKQKFPKKVSDRLRISARCDTIFLDSFLCLSLSYLDTICFLRNTPLIVSKSYPQEIPCAEALESDVTTITIVSLCVFACASPLPSPTSLFDLFDLSSFSPDLGISSGDCYS
ncbi:hypothetical protein M752DRAFT_142240 [Aspergillus phoenicis ATCC 13157]|jgi:hypothetical protein|uniref:Uncharacterized protein n=1 Tax=Aspergillus phoenicis ATCC 13157 TaxID=1353007 RepID=A0A370PQW6_ASPPH|nr:hypothetical protein M752DRAFT_142240 [Aspergillus phoenicis ATCC 13157]